MVELIKLDNGLTIVMEKNPFVRSIAFGIWVKNGSRNEDKSNNGISHFIEHMLFKGTKNRSAKDIADEMDAIGGQLNAYTSKENTCYYTRVLDNHFDIALDILSDMFFNSNFDDKEIEKEKNVIYEEISMYEDSPDELVHDILQSAVWKTDSLGMPILGTMESIKSFNHNVLSEYYSNNYCADNTVIAIAGNFDKDEMIEKITKNFSNFKDKKAYTFNKYNTSYNNEIVTKEKDIEQLHLCLSFEGLKMGHADSYVLSVLNTLFGGGMSSRLFQNIREDKGLVYTIYSYNSNYTNAGLFSIYAALNPTQSKDAIKYISEEIEKMRTLEISEKVLYNTKEQLKSNFLLSLESMSTRMSSIGRSQILLNKIYSPEQIAKKIDSVTIDDVKRLSNDIFDIKRISLSAVGKVKGLDFGI